MVIDSLIHKKKKRHISEFAGVWSFLSKEDAKGIEKEALKARKRKWRKVPKW